MSQKRGGGLKDRHPPLWNKGLAMSDHAAADTDPKGECAGLTDGRSKARDRL